MSSSSSSAWRVYEVGPAFEAGDFSPLLNFFVQHLHHSCCIRKEQGQEEDQEDLDDLKFVAQEMVVAWQEAGFTYQRLRDEFLRSPHYPRGPRSDVLDHPWHQSLSVERPRFSPDEIGPHEIILSTLKYLNFQYGHRLVDPTLQEEERRLQRSDQCTLFVGVSPSSKHTVQRLYETFPGEIALITPLSKMFKVFFESTEKRDQFLRDVPRHPDPIKIIPSGSFNFKRDLKNKKVPRTLELRNVYLRDSNDDEVRKALKAFFPNSKRIHLQGGNQTAAVEFHTEEEASFGFQKGQDLRLMSVPVTVLFKRAPRPLPPDRNPYRSSSHSRPTRTPSRRSRSPPAPQVADLPFQNCTISATPFSIPKKTPAQQAQLTKSPETRRSIPSVSASFCMSPRLSSPSPSNKSRPRKRSPSLSALTKSVSRPRESSSSHRKSRKRSSSGRKTSRRRSSSSETPSRRSRKSSPEKSSRRKSSANNAKSSRERSPSKKRAKSKKSTRERSPSRKRTSSKSNGKKSSSRCKKKSSSSNDGSQLASSSDSDTKKSSKVLRERKGHRKSGNSKRSSTNCRKTDQSRSKSKQAKLRNESSESSDGSYQCPE